MKNKFLKMLTLNINYYLWILFIFATATLMYDYVVAAVEYILLLLIAVLYYYNAHNKNTMLREYVNSLSYIPDDGSDVLSKFPMPVVIINTSSEIQWYNEAFSAIAGSADLYELPISDYIPSFNTDLIKPEEDRISADISHNGRYYHVFGNISIKSEEDKSGTGYIVLYWDDVTDHELLKKQYSDEQFVSCVAVVDNYEELMQDTPNQDKPKLTATIEEKLQSFAQDSEGILRKYEKDRFFFYFHKVHLDRYIENKFKILDEMKEISVGNKIPPTLSLGIGIGGESMSQNDAYSFSALDMALGRGGDQAIVKNNDQYSFFGGKSTGVEKRNRVKSRVVAYAIRELVSDADSIFIMGHARADVDVLGSALGLYRAFKTLGKDPRIIIDRDNQTVHKFIDSIQSDYRGVFITKATALEMANRNSLVVVVDTHKTTLVEVPELLNISKKIIVIDHHRRSADFIPNAIILYHEPFASSASELVTEVIQYMDNNIVITQQEAEALYAGIYMDTKSFTFKTGVRTFEAASYLKRRGVDTIKIKKLFQIDLNTFTKKWAIIEKAETLRNSIAIATCEKTDSDMQTIVAQATDEMLNISNINTSFVLCDMGESILISARSLGDTNVQMILEKLGGGGHMTIAGAQIKGVSLQEAYGMLINAINEYFENL